MYKIERHLYCGKMISIVNTHSLEQANDIYSEETSIFNAYSPEDKPVPYTTVRIALLKDDALVKESRHYFENVIQSA